MHDLYLNKAVITLRKTGILFVYFYLLSLLLLILTRGYFPRLFLERVAGRQRDREGNINVKETH